MTLPEGIEALEAGLRGTSLRSKAIANNIANIDTPNYRRKDVQFEQLLADAMETPGEGDLNEVEPLIVEPHATPLDSHGNDVNLDAEVGAMVKNGAAAKTYLRVMSKLYKQMETAIGGI